MNKLFHPWFAHPEAFWLGPLLVLAGLVALRGWRQRRRALELLGRIPAVRKLLLVDPRSRRLRHVCLFLGLVLLLLGSAEPQWGRDFSRETVQGQDVVVVLDVSRSMLAEQPSRLERSLRALHDLADHEQKRGGQRLALIVAAAQPHLVFPLTRDIDHFRFALAQIAAGDTPPGVQPQAGDPPPSGTRLGAALRLAVQSFDLQAKVPGNILLLSDGDDPAQDEEWRQGINAARAVQVPIHTVGIGDPTQEHPILIQSEFLMHDRKVVKSRLEEKILQEIAQSTGGVYIPAHTGKLALGTLFGEVLRSQRSEVGDEQSSLPLYQQRYEWFLWPALMLLAATLLIGTKRVATHTQQRAVIVSERVPRTKSSTLGASHSAVLILGAILLISAAPPEDDWIRQGNQAFSQNKLAEALTFFERAEPTTTDPGLVAFNKAAVLYRLEKYREAELHYRRCLEDDQAPSGRRAQADFGLGISLMRQGEKNRTTLEAAIDAFEQCLAIKEISPELAADARYNLELAKLLWLRAQSARDKSPADQKPGTEPKKKLDKRPTPIKDDARKNGKSPGDPELDKNGKVSFPRKSQDKKANPGNLQMLPDAEALVPLPTEDTAAYLDQLAERILQERRSYIRGVTPALPQVKDW